VDVPKQLPSNADEAPGWSRLQLPPSSWWTMGIRQSLGLVISPLKNSTGLGIAHHQPLRFAIAQLIWGAIQPIAGAVRRSLWSPPKVLIAGLVVPSDRHGIDAVSWTSGFGLIVLTGRSSRRPVSGASSFSVLIGAGIHGTSRPINAASPPASSTPGDRWGNSFLAPVTQNPDPDSRMDGCDLVARANYCGARCPSCVS